MDERGPDGGRTGDGVTVTSLAMGVPTALYLVALAAGGVPGVGSLALVAAAFLAPAVLASTPSRELQRDRGVPLGVRVATAWVAATGFGVSAALRSVEEGGVLALGWSTVASGATLLVGGALALPPRRGAALRALLFGGRRRPDDGARPAGAPPSPSDATGPRARLAAAALVAIALLSLAGAAVSLTTV